METYYLELSDAWKNNNPGYEFNIFKAVVIAKNERDARIMLSEFTYSDVWIQDGTSTCVLTETIEGGVLLAYSFD